MVTLAEYVPFTWEEYPHLTEQQKIDQLNHLETQYARYVEQQDAHGHLDDYYTKAECDAKYRAPGAAKGDYDMVDGYHGSDIIAMGIPPNSIMIWGGQADNVPAGFYKCNGQNSTPWLVGRALVGAGGSYEAGDMGGYQSHTPQGTLDVAGHTLTVDELPVHYHSMTDTRNTGYTGSCVFGGSAATLTSANRNTQSNGGDQPHGHPGSEFVGNEYDNRPPYMKLCFIKRAAV